MENQKKSNKGLIILIVILSLLVVLVWGIVLGLYYYGRHSTSEENIEKIQVSEQVRNDEEVENKEIILDEESKKQIEKIINEHEGKNEGENEEVSTIYSDIPQNNPDDYELNTASYIASKYLECWKNQDWLTMVEYTQKSWANKHDDSKERLEAQYSIKELLGAQIIKEEEQGENLKKVTYKVWYKSIDGEFEVKITVANVIREDGEWGVNPISALIEKNAYN